MSTDERTDRTDESAERTDLVAGLPARPRVRPGLRRTWRSARTLQLGVGRDHALTVENADRTVAALIDHLDGTLTRDQLPGLAHDLDLDTDVVLALVRGLATHGVLDDAAVNTSSVRALTRPERDRITVDLDAWGLAGPEPGPLVHERRRGSRVDVHGAGRVGALVATLLTHAGVGEVRVHDPQPLRAADVPAVWARGAPPADVAQRRDDVTLDVCEQLAPSLRTNRRRDTRTPPSSRPALCVLAPVDSLGTVDLELRDALMRASVPHLPAYVRETVGVVGPLVLPGRTACLRCIDLVRADRDAGWPWVLAQLTPPRGGTTNSSTIDAVDGVLATLVAAQAAMQALALLDGGSPTAVGATVETTLRDGITRHRDWPAHPACGCGWS